jgi:hypothetical protein
MKTPTFWITLDNGWRNIRLRALRGGLLFVGAPTHGRSSQRNSRTIPGMRASIERVYIITPYHVGNAGTNIDFTCAANVSQEQVQYAIK